MSWHPCPDPVPGDAASVDAIRTVITPHAVDLGEMEVRRALPSKAGQMVGPFIFFDPCETRSNSAWNCPKSGHFHAHCLST